MKKIAALAMTACLMLGASIAFAAHDDSAKGKMTGWVVDQKCGAKMANEGGAACAKRCAERGEPVVFVDDKDQTVLKVSNQDALKSHAGEHVTLSGKVDNGTLTVDNVAAAK